MIELKITGNIVKVKVVLVDGFEIPKETWVELNENETFKNVKFDIQGKDMLIFITEKRDEILDLIKKDAEKTIPRISKEDLYKTSKDRVELSSNLDPDPDLLENVFGDKNIFVANFFEINYTNTNYYIPKDILKRFPITKNTLVKIEVSDKTYKRKITTTNKSIPDLILHFTKEELQKLRTLGKLFFTFSCYKAKDRIGRVKYFGDLTYKKDIERCNEYTAKFNRFYYDAGHDTELMKNTMKDALEQQRDQ